MANPDEKLAGNRLGEIGFTGLKVDNGVIQENVIRDLTFPYSVNTYKEMSYDSSISSAINTIKDFVQGVEWSFDETEEGIDPNYPKGFLKQCSEDMDRTFGEYLNESLSILEYGFNVQEKVWKRRNQSGKYKSKYDDGLIGWAKLPTRSQDTIRKWIFTDDGRDLLGVQQDLALVPQNSRTRFTALGDSAGRINIPRDKFMLFRYDPVRNNPQGRSPLNNCYISWMYKKQLEETEASGIAKDMGGMMLIELPPEYMSEDAPNDKKQVFEYCKNLIRNYHVNQQAGVIFPRYIEETSKQNVFNLRLLGIEGGGKNYDLEATIKRHDMKILMTFLADVLALGHDGTGSFALSSDKTNLLAKKIASVLSYITKTFNEDLIPETFRRNGWSDKVVPKLVHSDLEKADFDSIGKLLQRVVSVGAMEVDKSLSNYLRSQLPLGEEGLGEALDEKLLPNSTSKASQSQGSSGTGNSQQGGSGSDTNSDNAA